MFVRPSPRVFLALVLLVTPALASAQQAAASASTASLSANRAGPGKQFTPADLQAWKTIRSASLSNDGKWFAYILAPNEGNATVVVRSTAAGAKELTFPIGEPPAPQFGPFGPATSALAISGDSKWVAFTIYPTQQDAKRLRKERNSSILSSSDFGSSRAQGIQGRR